MSEAAVRKAAAAHAQALGITRGDGNARIAALEGRLEDVRARSVREQEELVTSARGSLRAGSDRLLADLDCVVIEESSLHPIEG